MIKQTRLFFFVTLCSVFFSVFTSNAASPSSLKDSLIWKEVDQLVSEQKFDAALTKSLAILSEARKKGDSDLVANALVRSTQLQVGLHGYETAVRFLRTEPWPATMDAKLLLNLFYGQTLMKYSNAYFYDIQQREKTVSKNPVDLKAWTLQEINLEILRSFDAVMTSEKILSQPISERFKEFINKNSYPDGVRPLMKDAVVQLASAHLMNTQFWSPQQSQEVYKIKLKEILSLKQERRIDAALVQIHPLQRMASWMTELSYFHQAGGRKDAALEAKYSLFQNLHQGFTDEKSRGQIKDALKKLQAEQRSSAWWSWGQGILAKFEMEENRPGNLLRARAEALTGRDAFPATAGAQLCKSIIEDIERPAYDLSAMSVDGAKKKSIELEYKNLSGLRIIKRKLRWVSKSVSI